MFLHEVFLPLPFWLSAPFLLKGSKQEPSTPKKTTVPHIVPPVSTEKTTPATSASSTSKTSVPSEASPASSPAVPLPRTSPAPSSPLSTRLPSAAPSTVSSPSPPTKPMPTTFIPTLTSSESATYSSPSPNTTVSFTPRGETFSVALPTSVSSKSTPVVIPRVLPTTTAFAPSFVTTASTEIPSVEQTSIRTTTLTTRRTTSSLSVTSELSTSFSSVRPAAVPQENCLKVEYEEKITYKGCSANITLSRCEGSCPSSTKLNAETMEVTTACGCCRPLRLHKKEFQLPCEDPDNPRNRLIKEITVFGGCVCNFDTCIQ
ncbi:mucin-6-like [Cygnus atratus]|uniref:mucin-6-like n=1 Tax=Cygnus atratus TaxID=8868 RepID=UPI0021B70F5B|nr:mucin-6-like [Cygnus atratus]